MTNTLSQKSRNKITRQLFFVVFLKNLILNIISSILRNFTSQNKCDKEEKR